MVRRTGKCLLHRDTKLAVLDNLIDEAGDVGYNFKGQVAQWSYSPFNSLARVTRGEGDTKVLASGLHLAVLPWEGGLRGIICCMKSKSVKMPNQVRKILVVGVRLEAQLVLERNGKGDDEIHGRTG